MFFYNSIGPEFGTSKDCRCGINTPRQDSYEACRQRNELLTRDYFRGLYGADPMELGFEVPDWE